MAVGHAERQPEPELTSVGEPVYAREDPGAGLTLHSLSLNVGKQLVYTALNPTSTERETRTQQSDSAESNHEAKPVSPES